MPFAVAAPIAGAVGGALVSSALSPGTSGGGSNYYTPTGLGTADQTWQNLLAQQQGNQSYISGLLPYYQQSLDQGIGAQSYYGQPYQNAANVAGAEYANLAGTLNAQGQMNYGTQQNLLGAGQNVYNMGLDPQNALYNRTVQQLQDQTGATNSMYGLGSSAAGAGVANQALSNFNIDWQNNQLQRALSGLQGYGQAAGTAGQYGQLATNQTAAAPGYALQGGQVPYSTAQSLAGAPGQLAGQYASGIEQGPLSSASSITGQIIPYLNYGQGAQQVPYQANAQGAGAAGALFSQGVNSLGSNPQVQAGLGNIFGGGQGYSSFFGPTGGQGAFSSSPYYSGSNSYGFTT